MDLQTTGEPAQTHNLQTAEIDLRLGSFSAQAKVRVTPGGLLAIGGLVGCILLSTAVLVWSATSVRRKHPLATALQR